MRVLAKHIEHGLVSSGGQFERGAVQCCTVVYSAVPQDRKYLDSPNNY
jgi:hypothetical protein